MARIALPAAQPLLLSMLGALVALSLAGALAPTLIQFHPAAILPVRTAVEICAVVVGSFVFAVAWNARDEAQDARLTLAGCSFLVAALSAFAHAASSSGPLGPSSIGRFTLFSSAADLALATGLFALAFVGPGPLRSPFSRYAALACALLVTALLALEGFGIIQVLPAAASLQADVPSLPRRILGVLIIGLTGLAALRFYARSSAAARARQSFLFAGCVFLALREVLLTYFYRGGADLPSVLAQVYELMAYYSIYRGIIASGIRAPFELAGRLSDELGRAEERWHLALAAGGHGAWEWNLDTGTASRSGQWATLLGYAEEEFAETAITDFERLLHANDKERTLAQIRAWLDSQAEVWSGEFRLRCKDGSYKWIHARGKVVQRSVDGKPKRVIGTISDIGPRKQAETALRESEERYRRLVEMNPDAICLLREDRVAFANPAALQLVGAVALEQVVGQPILRFIHMASQPLAIERRNQLLAGLREANPPVEQQIVRLDGAIRDVEVASSVLHEDGRPASIQVAMRDITERKLAGEALRRSEAQLARAQQIARFGSYEVDVTAEADGRGNQWSAQTFRILGLDPRRGPIASQDYLSRIVHADDRRRVEEAMGKARAAGTALECEYRIVRGDGSIRYVHDFADFGNAGHGARARLFGVLHDITGRKLAEQALRESERKLRELTAHLELVREEERTRIARELHDSLGATLAAIKLDLASAAKCADPAESVAHIDRARESVQTLVVSTHQLIDDLRPSVLDLGLWAAIDWQAEQLANRTGIQCEFAIDEALHDHALDRERASALFRIVQESLTNVAKHASASRVDITAWYEDGDIVIEIEDNGRGVSEQDMFKINRWGIVGMHERARSFGGEVAVTGTQGHGTMVRMRMPRANERREDALTRRGQGAHS